MIKIKFKDSGQFEILKNEVVIGTGNMGLKSDENDFNYLERIDIEENFRGQGYGTQALLQIAEEVGEYCLTPDNESAKRLYDRIGEEMFDLDYSNFGFAIDQGYGVYII